MIKIELARLLRERDQTLYALGKATGIRWATLNGMANQTASRIDLELLDRICAVLRCEVGDLLVRKVERKPRKRGK